MDFLFSYFQPALLAMPRLAGAVFFAPFMSKEVLGGQRNKTAVIIVCALFIFPLIHQQHQVVLPFVELMGLIIKELVLGLMIGLIPLGFFYSMQMVGEFIDNQRGATSASSINPLLGEQSSPYGLLLLQTSIVLFFTTGGFVLFLKVIFESFIIWSVEEYIPVLSWDAISFITASLLSSLTICLLVASPIIIILILVEFSMGLIGRFSPQLDVFFLAMPIKSIVAVIILLFFWRYMINYFETAMFSYIANINGFLSFIRIN